MDLKSRILQSQIKAAVKVNTELLRFYWDLGQDIATRRMDSVWGSGFFEQLSGDLRREFPNMQGFSSTNLKYCKRFYLFYTQETSIRLQVVDEISQENHVQVQVSENKQDIIRHQVGDELGTYLIFQIPWRHHIEIISKCKSVKEALFYVKISAINHQKKKETDNPTIGMIICKTKDNIEVQYSLEITNQPIGISEYQLSKLLPDNLKSSLPSVEELEEELRKMES